MKLFFWAFLGMVFWYGGLYAQTPPAPLFSGSLEYSPGNDLWRPLPLASTEEDAKRSVFFGAPQWAKDLRRAEIVLFGSFPFTVFFTRTFMDLYRTASHDWDRRYAPWPFKAAGAVSMTNRELAAMFGIAVSSSLVIAVADHLIVRHKRNRAYREESGDHVDQSSREYRDQSEYDDQGDYGDQSDSRDQSDYGDQSDQGEYDQGDQDHLDPDASTGAEE